jgi:hypothetical protein
MIIDTAGLRLDHAVNELKLTRAHGSTNHTAAVIDCQFTIVRVQRRAARSCHKRQHTAGCRTIATTSRLAVIVPQTGPAE